MWRGQILICRGRGDGPKSSLPLWGRWISVKTLAFLPKDGRGPCRWDNICWDIGAISDVRGGPLPTRFAGHLPQRGRLLLGPSPLPRQIRIYIYPNSHGSRTHEGRAFCVSTKGPPLVYVFALFHGDLHLAAHAVVGDGIDGAGPLADGLHRAAIIDGRHVGVGAVEAHPGNGD